MRKSKSRIGLVALIMLGILIGISVLYPQWVWLAFGVLVILSAVVVLGGRQKKCQLCGVPIKRQEYRWEIDGEKKYICSKCNTRLENKASKEAVDRLFKG